MTDNVGLSPKTHEKLIISSLMLSLFLMVFWDKLGEDLLSLFAQIIIIGLGFIQYFYIKESWNILIKNLFFIVLFILLGLLVIFVSGGNWGLFFSFVKYCLFMLSIIGSCSILLRNINYVIVVSITIQLLFALYIIVSLDFQLVKKMTVDLSNSNSLGLLLSSGLSMSFIGLLLFKKKIIMSLVVVMFIVFCMFTNSRSSIISPSVSFLFVLFYSFLNGFFPKDKFKIALYLFLLCFIMYYFFYDLLFDTIISKFIYNANDISNGRFYYISHSVLELKAFMSTNVGYNIIVDNTFIAFAYDFGYVFSLCILVYLCIGLVLLFFIKNKLNIFLLFNIVNFLIYGNLESIRYTYLSYFGFMAVFYSFYLWANKNVQKYS